ncbi:catalytic subunit of serine/threonine-protein phosphatase 4, partial [Hamiltosporidium tvaerminnensis]
MENYLNALLTDVMLKEEEIGDICDKACEILLNEPNMVNVPSPVLICGDIHGQYYDLLTIFKINGTPKSRKYIFLGDYVDRGANGLECFCLLLVYKIMYPSNIFLIRGNHESKDLTKIYGFYDEVAKKYGNSRVWRYCCDVFECLINACLVNGRIFCVHGGLSPSLLDIDEINRIYRLNKLPDNHFVNDLMWSDPDELNPGFSKNSRGAGYTFGSEVTKKFLEINNLTMLVRSHQLAFTGYQMHFKEKCAVTVWSAPNYCYRCGNLASV